MWEESDTLDIYEDIDVSLFSKPQFPHLQNGNNNIYFQILSED